MAACGIAPEDDDGNAGTDAKRRQDSAPPAQDMSPKARALRIIDGVTAGDATGAAAAMAGWDEKLRDAVWALLPAKTQEKLTAAWPKETTV